MVPISEVSFLSDSPRVVQLNLKGWFRLIAPVFVIIIVAILEERMGAFAENAIIASVVATVPIIGFVYLALRTWQDITFGRICELTQGKIAGQYTDVYQNKRSTDTFYKMSYVFKVGEESFSREVQVTRLYNLNHSDGEVVMVLFDPVDPNNSRLQGEMSCVSTTPGSSLHPISFD